MPVKKYREQVMSVDACQYDGTNKQELMTWAESRLTETEEGELRLEVPGGMFIIVNVTDWIYNDVYGGWWKMLDRDFQITYAPGPEL